MKKAEIIASHLNFSIGQIIEISEFRPQIQIMTDKGEYAFQSRNLTAYGVN